jgi:hypothetical protein
VQEEKDIQLSEKSAVIVVLVLQLEQVARAVADPPLPVAFLPKGSLLAGEHVRALVYPCVRKQCLPAVALADEGDDGPLKWRAEDLYSTKTSAC